MSDTKLIKIFIAPSQGKPQVSKDEITAEVDRGLVGDRYYLGTGHYSGDPVWDANVTLIDEAAFTDSETGEALPLDCLRRNLVTRGVDLRSLLGKEFQIGSAVFTGTKYWPPCSYMDQQNDGRNVLKRFAKTGGIGATVVQSGCFRVGDPIEVHGAPP